ncbi:MAG: outer membrane beta-barrel protein [Bacteroidota bacterium]|nr:outer membrane beta-barrel protein [Bacteroidota bacterium]
MKKSIYSIALGLLGCASVFAQDTSATKKDEGKFTVNGYIDSYYLTAFNNPKSGQLLGASAGRAFDRVTDQFGLGLVQTRFAYTNSKSEMVIDLTFGPNAELGNFGNVRPMISGVTAVTDPATGAVTGYAGTGGGTAAGYYPTIGGKQALYGTSAAIKQAYFKYNITDKLSFTVGQFGTHIGYEVIDAPVNYHYSLSNLFNNGPFYHVGGKLNYAFSDKLGVMLGVVNNWDALTDWKKQKSVIGQFYVSPISGWNVYVNFIGGHNDDGYKIVGNQVEPGFATPNYNRMLFDLTTGYQVTSKFYIGLNAAYGMYSFDKKQALASSKLDPTTGKMDSSSTIGWYGVALYPNYQITDMIGVGVRYEFFNDQNAVRYFGGINNSVTVTVPITLADGHLIIKPEFRMDIGERYVYGTGKKVAYYEDKDGKIGALDAVTGDVSPGGTTTQTTFGVAFIYKY